VAGFYVEDLVFAWVFVCWLTLVCCGQPEVVDFECHGDAACGFDYYVGALEFVAWSEGPGGVDRVCQVECVGSPSLRVAWAVLYSTTLPPR
jgi:hypothetical protein